MEIKIPFKEDFKDDMGTGDKICTTRSKKYGKVGDTFKVFDLDFKIIAIFKLPFHKIAFQLYNPEGCVSTANFLRVWHKIHHSYPEVSSDISEEQWNKEYYIHFFK